MTKTHAEKAQERLEKGGVILAYPAGGIVVPVARVRANQHIPGPSVGSGISRCGQCTDVFNSVSAFDLHQTIDPMGNVVCWESESIGMVRDKFGRWVTRLDDRTYPDPP